MIKEILIQGCNSNVKISSNQIVFETPIKYSFDQKRLIITNGENINVIDFEFEGDFILTIVDSPITAEFIGEFPTFRPQIYDRNFKMTFNSSFKTIKFYPVFFEPEAFTGEPMFIETVIQPATKKEILDAKTNFETPRIAFPPEKIYARVSK